MLHVLRPEATTVGYGDYVPTTTVGKIVAISTFYLGIAAWPDPDLWASLLQAVKWVPIYIKEREICKICRV